VVSVSRALVGREVLEVAADLLLEHPVAAELAGEEAGDLAEFGAGGEEPRERQGVLRLEGADDAAERADDHEGDEEAGGEVGDEHPAAEEEQLAGVGGVEGGEDIEVEAAVDGGERGAVEPGDGLLEGAGEDGAAGRRGEGGRRGGAEPEVEPGIGERAEAGEPGVVPALADEEVAAHGGFVAPELGALAEDLPQLPVGDGVELEREVLADGAAEQGGVREGQGGLAVGLVDRVDGGEVGREHPEGVAAVGDADEGVEIVRGPLGLPLVHELHHLVPPGVAGGEGFEAEALEFAGAGELGEPLFGELGEEAVGVALGGAGGEPEGGGEAGEDQHGDEDQAGEEIHGGADAAGRAGATGKS